MSQQIRQITQKSPDFPKILLEIPHPPKTLNVWGKVPKTEHYISIVGARKNSAYGEEILRKIISGLAPHGFTIISGLAVGIDSVAHKAALENNMPTIGILGSGLQKNVFFPFQNWKLAENIVSAGGAVISEYENDMKAAYWSFPQRNRIISGLSKATLIVEAGEKSGSLITARFALDQNREVMAVPGMVYSANSKGTNRLIKQGAHLIESAEDVLEIYGINFTKQPSCLVTEQLGCLTPQEKIIFDTINEPADIDTIIRACKMPSYEVQAVIGLMELRGIIKKVGNEYIKS
ncbi:MAG TPA: DNA-processing protein DprA [Candidatus Paceibacterota bacterium]